MAYEPAPEVFDRYADVMVDFALGNGEGIKADDVVYIAAPTSALPLYRALFRKVVDTGGRVIEGLRDDMGGLENYLLTNTPQERLAQPMDDYYGGLANEADHFLSVDAEYDSAELSGIDMSKRIARHKSRRKLTEGLYNGQLAWTIALYGTEAMAERAGMTPEEYWNQIIRACQLDKEDPVAEWRKISAELGRIAGRLSDMQIQTLHIEGQDVDLEVAIGQKRKWISTSGHNIPSYEVYTSPDYRGTKGLIHFRQPVYFRGQKFEGVTLNFRDGQVVEYTASSNLEGLRKLLEAEPAGRRLGEVSLTDRRHSRIDRVMQHTLYDENIGGEFGNFHIAIGNAYQEAIDADVSQMDDDELEGLGFNKTQSGIHTDMILLEDRKATARLEDGSEAVIYQRGQFSDELLAA